eukprot:SAG22_NODE_214_length_15003_cov_18.466519_17_plen_186_part_00
MPPLLAAGFGPYLAAQGCCGRTHSGLARLPVGWGCCRLRQTPPPSVAAAAVGCCRLVETMVETRRRSAALGGSRASSRLTAAGTIAQPPACPPALWTVLPCADWMPALDSSRKCLSPSSANGQQQSASFAASAVAGAATLYGRTGLRALAAAAAADAGTLTAAAAEAPLAAAPAAELAIGSAGGA